jgi:hypothetical protein
MNRELALKLILDFSMTILLLCAYAYRITGDTAHEWIGISVFVLFITHNIINRRWYKNIFKGKYTVRRALITTFNVLIALVTSTLLVTGLLHSRAVLAFLFAAFGVWSSFYRDMFAKLFQGFSFDYWDEARPALLFFVLVLSIIAVYVFFTYYLLKIYGRKNKQE